MIYADDHNGVLMRAHIENTRPTYWATLLTDGRYLPQSNVFFCPNQKTNGAWTKQNSARYTYGLNRNLKRDNRENSTGYYINIYTADKKHASSITWLVGDSAMRSQVGTDNATSCAILSWNNGAEAIPALRHQHQVNFGFLDGSARANGQDRMHKINPQIEEWAYDDSVIIRILPSSNL